MCTPNDDQSENQILLTVRVILFSLNVFLWSNPNKFIYKAAVLLCGSVSD